MDAHIVTNLLSVVAIMISILSLYFSHRNANLSLKVQESTWRQKVGEELAQVSFLLTQNELSSQRSESRSRELEGALEKFERKTPNHPAVAATRRTIEEGRAFARAQIDVHKEVRKELETFWAIEQPTADLMVRLQQINTGMRNRLAQYDQMEEQEQTSLQEFLESMVQG